MTAIRPLRLAPFVVSLCLAIARLGAASDEPGVDCAKLKLKAAAKAVASKLKCYAHGAFPNLDPGCLTRAEERMAIAFERAEGLECFGPHDDEAEARANLKTDAEALLKDFAPPQGCGLQSDGFTCDGPCTLGRVCMAFGNTCNCVADVWACNATAVVPAVCPKIGQTCVDRTCQDPTEGYCREEPAGAGMATGFCPGGLTCLIAGQAQCVPQSLSCEDPTGACAVYDIPLYGLCADRTKTCGPDCICQ
jgi:hypothetical protein